MGTLAPQRNAGPVFAAIGIAFNNDPAIIGTASALLLIISIVTVAVAAYLAQQRAPTAALQPTASQAPVTGKTVEAGQVPSGALPA
jgi:hypothetical protein